jgi:hypothetical protein
VLGVIELVDVSPQNGGWRIGSLRIPQHSVEDDGRTGDRETVSLDGETYLRAVGASVGAGYRYSSSGSLSYNLGRDFEAVTGTLGFSDDGSSSLVVRVEFFADGRLLAKHDVRLGRTVDLALDVVDVLRLRIEWTVIEGSDAAWVGIGDAQLLGDPDVVADLPQRHPRVLGHAEERGGMVSEKRPLTHTGK